MASYFRSFFLIAVLCSGQVWSAPEDFTRAQAARIAREKAPLIVHQARSRAKELAKQNLKLAFDAYGQGQYFRALKILDKIKSGHMHVRSLAKMLQGVLYNRLENFQAAEKYLQLAKELAELDPRWILLLKGLHYELGQAQYALGKIALAQKNFLLSVKYQFQVEHSLYYVAELYRSQKKYRQAFEIFEKLIRLPTNPGNIRQLSWYRLAQAHFEQYKKAKDQAYFLKSIVLPRYVSALNENPHSLLARTIQADIKKVRDLHAKLYSPRNKIKVIRKKNQKELNNPQWNENLDLP